MKPEPEIKGGFATALAAFGLYAIPILFISPYQYLANKNTFGRWQHILSPAQATTLDILQWSVIAVVFAWGTRRVKFGLLLPLTLAVITLTLVATHLVVRVFGLSFYLGLWR
ncbi:MAG TPA: hypothetical protein VHO24_06360 [Opitutaceae bacterium]|nr:hypothetical protein [Opitutaceae bacterium]